MEISTQDKRGRRKGRILVYDDDRLLLDVLVTMLRREGHQVTATHSDQEAMALARAQHFDLAVVDLGRQRSNLLALRYRFLISRRYFLRSFNVIPSSLGIFPSVTLSFE